MEVQSLMLDLIIQPVIILHGVRLQNFLEVNSLIQIFLNRVARFMI